MDACNTGIYEHCIYPVECPNGPPICERPYGIGCDCIPCNAHAAGCPPNHFCLHGFPGYGACCVEDVDDCLWDDSCGDDSGDD